jgi:hypothetical protein
VYRLFDIGGVCVSDLLFKNFDMNSYQIICNLFWIFLRPAFGIILGQYRNKVSVNLLDDCYMVMDIL